MSWRFLVGPIQGIILLQLIIMLDYMFTLWNASCLLKLLALFGGINRNCFIVFFITACDRSLGAVWFVFL
jgi:hypothetical protein